MAGSDDFLSRWSRRKTQARAGAPAEPAPAMPAVLPVGEATAPEAAKVAEPVPLPPVESLTTESDFQPFMASGVDPGVRRAALKALFADPRYNVMDMLDTYVDDYSKPDPLPEGWLEKLEQVSRLGDRAGRDRAEAERKAAEVEAQRKAAEAQAQAEQASAQALSETRSQDLPDDERARDGPPSPVAADPPGEAAGLEPKNPQ